MPNNDDHQVTRPPRTPFTSLLFERRPTRPQQTLGLAGEITATRKTAAHNNFLGLSVNPFSVASGPASFALTTRTQRLFEDMVQALESHRGLLVLTGDVGTGKTTVVNQVRSWLRKESIPTAFIFNPLLDVSGFFNLVLAEFGIPVDPSGLRDPITRLHNWLEARYRECEPPVLIVDEAQGLSLAVLESIVIPLNWEVRQEKLLQIVLAGQPELNEKLNRPELRKLHQRIALRCSTAALTEEEIRSYVELRLRAAGSDGQPVFSLEALDSLYIYSQGIPRVLNLLCEHSLITACSQRIRPVPPEIVEEVARQFQFDGHRPIAPSTYSTCSSGSVLPVPGSTISLSSPNKYGDNEMILAELPTVVVTSDVTLRGKFSRIAENESRKIKEPLALCAEQVAAVSQKVCETELSANGLKEPQTGVIPDSHPQTTSPERRITAVKRLGSALVVAKDRIRNSCTHFSESFLRWLNAPLGAQRPRRTLGTRRA